MKSELSKKSYVYIPGERYLELKHFCLQYPHWVKYVSDTYAYIASPYLDSSDKNSSNTISSVEVSVIKASEYKDKIEMVETAAADAVDDEINRVGQPGGKDVSKIIYDILIDGVTKNMTYDKINEKYHVSYIVDRNHYYRMYRRFFKYLSAIRK